ncbi:PREDICTED: apolipoprotein C-IV [Elephantulus edwardii]|uniref:apolipoprotein C-IV n=1 Tax=Elephantulus edwardii TaxID=28737 RepID=UPI0003F0655A|nr:PREDICTED: apolipoprotein C-IV [Elephantulus edwardii]
MALPGCKSRILPSLCICVLVLACEVVCQDEGSMGSPSPQPPSQVWSRWNMMRGKMNDLVTRTKDKWQQFWKPGALQGFMQTYYEDHLKDLGTRTQTWLHSSKDALLEKAHSLCPRLICRD